MIKKKSLNCFKLPNELILDKSLQYSYKKVCAAIYYFRNQLNFCVKSIEQLANKTGLSEATVIKAVEALEDKGYITRTRNYIYHPVLRRPVYQKSSYVCLKPLHKSFTLIPNDIFSFSIRSSSFVLFTYFIMMIGNKNRAFPSLNKMMQDLGMAKSSICSCIKEHLSAGLIHVEHCVTKLGEFAQNSYFCIKNAEPKKNIAQRAIDGVKSIISAIAGKIASVTEKPQSGDVEAKWDKYMTLDLPQTLNAEIRRKNESNSPMELPLSILLL